MMTSEEFLAEFAEQIRFTTIEERKQLVRGYAKVLQLREDSVEHQAYLRASSWTTKYPLADLVWQEMLLAAADQKKEQQP